MCMAVLLQKEKGGKEEKEKNCHAHCVSDHFQQLSTMLSIKITHFRARQYHFKILKFCGALCAHFIDLGLHHFLFFNCKMYTLPPKKNQLDGLTPLYKVGHWTPRVAILCSLCFIYC